MTKTAYGIPVPRGVQKDWASGTWLNVGKTLNRFSVPDEWGEPSKCAIWRDRFGRLRLIITHYANGRSATVRIDANGISKTTFGDVE